MADRQRLFNAQVPGECDDLGATARPLRVTYRIAVLSDLLGSRPGPPEGMALEDLEVIACGMLTFTAIVIDGALVGPFRSDNDPSDLVGQSTASGPIDPIELRTKLVAL